MTTLPQFLSGDPMLGWFGRLIWQTSLLIVAVAVVQRLLRRWLSSSWRYNLWLLVMVRLVLPVSWESPASVFNLFEFEKSLPATPVSAVYPEPATPEAGEVQSSARALPVDKALAPGTGGENQVGRGHEAGASNDEWPVRFWLVYGWLMGAVLFGLYVVVEWRFFQGSLRRARPVATGPALEVLAECARIMGIRGPVPLLEVDHLQSPSVHGLFRPKVLVSGAILRQFTAPELRCIFLHELGHIKRRDLVVNWLAILLQGIYWFNPLVWLAFGWMRSDRELACDALVLSRTRVNRREEYGATIIKLLEMVSGPRLRAGMVGLVEEKEQIKRRIRMIARFRGINRGAPLAVPAFLALAVTLLTDAVREQSPEPSGPPQTITLQGFYDAKPLTWFNNPDWQSVPHGRQVFHGIPFDISGTLLLRGENENGRVYRERVQGIPVGRAARLIYLLHGTGHPEAPGTPIADMRVHYRDGRVHTFTIQYGVHVRDWWWWTTERTSAVSDPGSAIYWSRQTSNPAPQMAKLRLYGTAFRNPYPEDPIESVDFISRNSRSIPVIVSLSVGNQAPLDGTSQLVAEEPVRSMALRLVDAQTGAAVPGAKVQVELDDLGVYDNFSTSKDGRVIIPFTRSKYATVRLVCL
ncbi:MAG: M56 family metallopeptidase, partial [Candidatus Omnitrophica bacterium]|nr:M56 family metallopeptidase [Candidatus Omnitrophota bacterium]